MAYKKGEDRRQRVLFPDCIDDYVGQDAPVRLMDAFIDHLDMEQLGFQRFTPADTGAPGYDPRDLMKLYVYGYYYEVRSSRKLARQCSVNIEVMWLLNKLTPDFRTIADFRKDNKKAIEKTFREFNRFCYGEELFSKNFVSIDGSKFKAVNAKDRNFTLNKLDDRIARLDQHIARYMEELDECDEDEGRKLSREELEHKLEVCKERKELYEGYREQLEQSGEKQISLTDPDAYKDILSGVKVCDVKAYRPNVTDAEILKMSDEQMRTKAAQGYFVRDAERNLVYCPQGEVLRQKSIKRNGMIRYCNKLACKRCKHKCTSADFKEADFNKDTLIITARGYKTLTDSHGDAGGDKPQRHHRKTVVKKVVSYVLHLDERKMDQRKCLSEHPFGTLKRSLGQYYFLLKGFAKVTAEMAMFCLSYNMRRAINIKGVPALLAALR